MIIGGQGAHDTEITWLTMNHEEVVGHHDGYANKTPRNSGRTRWRNTLNRIFYE